MQAEQFQLHADLEEQHWWFVARRRIMRALVEQLVAGTPEKDRQATVIDVGCGTGANIAALADGYRAFGIFSASEASRWASASWVG